MNEKLKNSLANIVSSLYSTDIDIELDIPEEKFGDVSTNIAMKLAKKLDNPPAGGPQDIANQIVEKLSENELVKECSVAGPGFINIYYPDKFLIDSAVQRSVSTYDGKKYVVEYSDPNPFKPLHAGHLYTTLVGDVIARLVERAGAETIRINFGGDVGLHVAKCMWAVVKEIGEDLSKLDKIEADKRAIWLGERYVEGNNAYSNNESAKAEIVEINKKIYALHDSGDKESAFAQIYWTLRADSYESFKELYKKLEVKEFNRFIPESEVSSLGLETVRNQLENGVYELSDGAVIFDGDKYGLHKRVFINSEGLPTYEAKDVGLNLTKWKDYQYDKSIIITANEIDQYMQVVLKSIEQFEPEPANRTIHLTHGMVKLAGGVKMSSRKGNVLMANDVLEAAEQASAISEHQNEQQTVLAAIKYAFVKFKIGGDIIYDPNESVALEGNSGPYLQYAHARARSIIRKSETETQNIEPKDLEADERSLVRKLSEYNSVLLDACVNLSPHLICNYLYELAQKFNQFYERNKVIGDDRQDIRLWIVDEYSNTLKHGLELLGINAPEKM